PFGPATIRQTEFITSTKRSGQGKLDRSSVRSTARFLVAAAMLCHAHGYARSGPQPPCGTEPDPAYPGLDDPAIVKLWSKSDFGRDWIPPACTGWSARGFTTL